MKQLLKEEFVNFFQSIRKIFKYKKNDRRYSTKKILVAGGYGYGNTGDEAQCDATLRLLSERYSEFQVVDLTPNVEYSKKQHPEFSHDFASRVMFFGQMRECNCWDRLDNSFFMKIFFLIKSFWILFNAVLVRADFPILLVNAKIAKFLYELRECSLFYFCGGGYLTGGTLSRLWDGILICRLCHLFKTPVVMSGQTIGVWRNKFNMLYAKWGFKYVKIITVRDEDFSLYDLKKIGLNDNERYFSTHDDALHCSKSIDKQVVDKNEYIALNFHYWGMNQQQRLECIDRIHEVVEYISKTTQYDIIFIPMHSSDKVSFDDYVRKYNNERLKCYNYDYDFRKVRRVIADSKMCITMKHHPVIFAMGENVPVLSLAYSDYYVHKNIGALAQYGQEKFSVNLDSKEYYDKVISLFQNIMENYDKIVSEIKNRKEVLDYRKEKYLQKVDAILRNN